MKRVLVVFACMAAVVLMLWCACRVAFGYNHPWDGEGAFNSEGNFKTGPWAVSREGGPFRDDFSKGLDAWESSVNWEVKAGYARLVLYDSQYVTPPDGVDDLANLIPNGDFESGTTGWTAQNGAVLATSTTAHSGAQSLSMTRGSANICTITANFTLPAGWAKSSAYLRNTDSTLALAYLETSQWGGGNSTAAFAGVGRTWQNASSANVYHRAGVLGSAGQSSLLDSVGTYSLPSSNLFCVRYAGTSRSVKARVWPGLLDACGVAACVDSASSPTRALVAYYQPYDATAKLARLSGGAWTTLVSGSVTKVNFAYIEIRRDTGNTYSLWYNGAKIGASQTHTPGVNETKYGLFMAGGAYATAAEYANLNGVSGGAAAGFDNVEVW
jgi:hypothetical protein